MCADLSFTSLEKIIPTITWSLAEQSIGAFLIKPQFEAEKHEIQPGGLVLDPAVHARVCQRIEAFMGDVGFRSFQCIRSPITGTKGNIEFILMCVWDPCGGVETSSTEIQLIVRRIQTNQLARFSKRLWSTAKFLHHRRPDS